MIRGIRRSESGASAVEFAIVASVLLMIVFGTIQFGIAYNRQQSLEAGAREGARNASIGGLQSDVTNRVQKSVSLINGSDVTLKFEYSTDSGTSWTTIANNSSDKPCNDAGTGNLVRVTATVTGNASTYYITIPLVGSLKPTFSAQGIFRCEVQ
jgi:Flp pilus assembly protein TadG